MNFSDPFGLCANKDDPACSIGQQIIGNIRAGVDRAVAAVGDFGNSLAAGLKSLAKEAAIEGGVALATGGAGSGIRVTARGAAHVMARHFPGGAQAAGKSIFNAAESVAGLVEGAGGVGAIRQANGNFQRVVTAGRNVGVDRASGAQTNVYTVITNNANDLVTMFPGTP